ncbi:MAG TPA: hypothetical protein VMW91_11345, partial [Desulfosporosinus sp.]|nr:hypothetical protein [Desulfosporosinus sp.]
AVHYSVESITYSTDRLKPLLAFKTFDEARDFTERERFSLRNLEIWFAQAAISEVKHNKTDIWHGGPLIGDWPDGTIFCDWIKLVTRCYE